MFSSNPIEINKSSLVSLKAEILRKQQELKTNKTFDKPVPRPIVTKQKKKQNEEPKERYVEDEEDKQLLAKSKQILESKTKLYNILSKGTSNLSDKEREISKRTLVQFNRKEPIQIVNELSDEEQHSGEEYDAKNPDEEWVEYVDALGRTRKCLRKDLNYMKRKDRDLSDSIEGSGRLREEPQKFVKEIEEEEPKEEITVVELSDENELLSSDMRREILRREWEKQEEELLNRKNIHYQDLLFNEARSHGVSYYAFSHDEEERAKQQENLKKLRTETKEKQKATSELKALREKQLAARLKAARNRKRARMGLPPEEEEPEKPKDSEIEDEEEKHKQVEKEAEEKRKQEERDRFVRPWDIGKEILKKHYEYSQEEWVSKKRKERPTDFAPPSTYGRDRRVNNDDDYVTSNKSLYFSSKKNKEKSGRNINPYLPENTGEYTRDDNGRSSSDYKRDVEGTSKSNYRRDAEESLRRDDRYKKKSTDSISDNSKIDFIFEHTKKDGIQADDKISFKFENPSNSKGDDEINFIFKSPERKSEPTKSSDSESVNMKILECTLEPKNISENEIGNKSLEPIKLNSLECNVNKTNVKLTNDTKINYNSEVESKIKYPVSEPKISFTFKRSMSDENNLNKKLKPNENEEYISPFSFPTPVVYPSYDMGVTLPEGDDKENSNDEGTAKYSPSHLMEGSDSEEDIQKNDSLEKNTTDENDLLTINPAALEQSVMAGLRYLREKAEKKSKKNRDEDFIS